MPGRDGHLWQRLLHVLEPRDGASETGGGAEGADIAPHDLAQFIEQFARGDIATYRIHLGSSNVIIDPPGRFLCIVEGSATLAMPRNLALPFEEDHKLSQILSKAFMLANDRKIKDQSILRQFP